MKRAEKKLLRAPMAIEFKLLYTIFGMGFTLFWYSVDVPFVALLFLLWSLYISSLPEKQ